MKSMMILTSKVDSSVACFFPLYSLLMSTFMCIFISICLSLPWFVKYTYILKHVLFEFVMHYDETLESIRLVCDGWLCCWLTFIESNSSEALVSKGLSSMYFLVGNELYL